MSCYSKTSFLQTMQLSNLIVREKKKLRSIDRFKAFPLYSNVLAFFWRTTITMDVIWFTDYDSYSSRTLYLSFHKFCWLLWVYFIVMYVTLPSFLPFFKLKNENFVTEQTNDENFKGAFTVFAI